MIGASSGLRPNQPELSATSSRMPDIANSRPPSKRGPMQRPSAQLRDRRPVRQRQAVGADQPDQIRQRQHDDHQQREQRIERHQRAPSARGRERKSGDQQQQADAAEVVSSRSPASIDHANHALRRFWPISCQECSSNSAQSGRASTCGPNSSAGRTECRDRHGQEDREHRLLSADDGARQQIKRPERRDRAKLRQQIDAEHVIAGGAKRDIGEPERQRRAEIGSDLVFPAIGEHGRKVAGRASIQQ